MTSLITQTSQWVYEILLDRPTSSSSSGEGAQEPESFWFYQQDPESNASRSLSTTDLISWSFQIARGMDYLASRKVSRL